MRHSKLVKGVVFALASTAVVAAAVVAYAQCCGSVSTSGAEVKPAVAVTEAAQPQRTDCPEGAKCCAGKQLTKGQLCPDCVKRGAGFSDEEAQRLAPALAAYSEQVKSAQTDLVAQVKQTVSPEAAEKLQASLTRQPARKQCSSKSTCPFGGK